METLIFPLNQLEPDNVEGELKRLPLYPSASEVKTWKADHAPAGSVAFVTTATEEKVYSFYDNVLKSHGWVQVPPQRPFPTYAWTWSAKNGNVPWSQSLELNVKSSTAPMGKRTHVVLDLKRLPVSVPLYRDAGQVRSKVVHENCNHRETSISYVTIATGKKIESYYKALLVESGWTYDEDESKRLDATPGYFFRAYNGYHLITLSLNTQPKAPGFTEVVLKIGELVLGDI